MPEVAILAGVMESALWPHSRGQWGWPLRVMSSTFLWPTQEVGEFERSTSYRVESAPFSPLLALEREALPPLPTAPQSLWRQPPKVVS